MPEEQFWELLDRLTKQVVETENCVLDIVISAPGLVEVQLIPKDMWCEGCENE